MNKKDKITTILIAVALISYCYVMAYQFLNADEIYTTEYDMIEPYVVEHWTDTDSGLLEVHTINSSGNDNFPQDLYYRNGTIAGWLINGTFTTENPWDIWIWLEVG